MIITMFISQYLNIRGHSIRKYYFFKDQTQEVEKLEQVNSVLFHLCVNFQLPLWP